MIQVLASRKAEYTEVVLEKWACRIGGEVAIESFHEVCLGEHVAITAVRITKGFGQFNLVGTLLDIHGCEGIVLNAEQVVRDEAMKKSK